MRKTNKPEDEDKVIKSRMFYTKDQYKDLIKMYERAIKTGKTNFIFENETLTVPYAKYLLNYLKQNGY